MAIINIDTDRLRNINSNISTLDNTLLNSYIPSLESELQNVYNNVQNVEVRNIISTINEKISSITASLKTDLPRLEEFLDSQLSSYQSSVEEAESTLKSVVAKMGALAGINTIKRGDFVGREGGGFSGQVGAGRNSEEKGIFTDANAMFIEKSSDNWENFIGSYEGAFDNTLSSHGVISGIGNAIFDTVGVVGSTIPNVLQYGLNEIAIGTQWVGDVAFGENSLLGVIWDSLI